MELVLIGIIAGFLAGFFGVGGGMITVPLLLYAGIPIKLAIGISSMQMVFSSIYGTFRNIKKRSLDIKESYLFGLGGIAGSFIGGLFLDRIDSRILGYIFLLLIVFALVRVLYASNKTRSRKKIKYPLINLIIGLGIGIIAGMLGVGGSILLIPVLVGFLYYTTKDAVSVGLFFVMFSSLSAFVTLSWLGYVDHVHGAIVAVSSLLGVRLGQFAGEKTDMKSHKKWMIALYSVLLIIMTNKIIN